MSDQCWIGDTNSIELGMDDNIPYYDGLVGTLQLKRCTMYHLRYTMYHKTNALAAACPCDATGEYHSVPGAGGEVVRSCVARFCIRAHASHHNNNISRQEGATGGRGSSVKGGDITHFTHLNQLLFPPFLSPITSSTHRRKDTHPLKSTLFRYESNNNPDSLSRNPQKTTRINTNTSYLIHDVHEIRHHRPLRARRHCQPGRWTDPERYRC